MLANIPGFIRYPLLVGGSLLSAFASRLPETWQDIGLCAGIILAGFGLFATLWHWLRSGRPELSNWFKAKRRPERDWNLAQAFQYWAENTDRSETFHADIENAAFDENIRIWGVRDFREDAIYEPVPPIHWSKSTIEADPAIFSGSDDPQESFILKRSRTRPRQKNDDVTRYWKLMVSSDEFRERWPPRPGREATTKLPNQAVWIGSGLLSALVLVLALVYLAPATKSSCAPKENWQPEVYFEPDPQLPSESAAVRRVLLTPRTKSRYIMTIEGRAGGLRNMNVYWEGVQKEFVRKYEDGGIILTLTDPVGLVSIYITPDRLGDMDLNISYECIAIDPR